MNTTATMDETIEITEKSPGLYLSEARVQRGYSQEYVANKLHLRVRIVELIETDDYQSMPEPVFIKGYLRAYAKLLDISPDPLIEIYKLNHNVEKKVDKALWQSRRKTNSTAKAVRWVTVLFAAGVLVSIALWWQKNKTTTNYTTAQTAFNSEGIKTDIRLTDLSKMQPLLSSTSDLKPAELNGG